MSGAGGITRSSVTPLNPSSVAPVWQITAVGDATAEGWPDILWRNVTTGEIAMWKMQGVNLQQSNYLSIPSTDVSWKILAPK